MSNQEYTVYHRGKPKILLNKDLVEKQQCKNNLTKIKRCHVELLELEEKMRRSSKPETLRELDREYTRLEFLLQECWKFPKDSTYHKFWKRPKCLCPKLDNEERYPLGKYYINKGCILHGGDHEE